MTESTLPDLRAQPAWIPPRALANVLLAGVLLRLMALGYWSLWLDEGATWSWAAHGTWKDTIFAEANHPPLWWAVTRAWISLFGDSEAALRMPAALCGVVSTGLAWLLALRLLDPASAPRRGGFARADDGGAGRRTAAWVAGLIALSAYFVEYAQEARMYPALLVEALLLALLYLRWLDRNDRLSLVLYALVGALGLYTHYFALWPILAHGAHALFLARRTRGSNEPLNPWPFLGAVVASGLLFVPWFAYLVTHFQRIAHIAPEPFSYVLYAVWRMGAGPGLVAPDRLTQLAGPIAELLANWPVVLAVTLLWFPPLVLGARTLRRRPGLCSFVWVNLLLPIALLLAVYPLFPLIHERYLIFVAPWIFLLAALGARAPGRVGRTLLLGGLVVLMLGGVVAYHGASRELVPVNEAGQPDPDAQFPWRYMPDPDAPLYALQGAHPYGREPWRQAHAFVRSRALEGDLVALHPGYVHLAWDFYAAHGQDEGGNALAPLETVELPNELLSVDALIQAHGDVLRDRRRVFLVLAHEETKDPDDYYRLLQKALGRLWIAEGHGIRSVPPILFHLSWGVRVAVFTRT